MFVLMLVVDERLVLLPCRGADTAVRGTAMMFM
jgi:hypothetical protein